MARVTTPTTISGRQSRSLPLSELLDTWVAEQIITPEQAVRMSRGGSVRVTSGIPTAQATSRAPVVVEALGYLGGAIIVAAATMMAAQYWSDVSTAGRLALVGFAGVALVAAGFAPRTGSPPAIRLTAVLWALSIPTTMGFFQILGSQQLDLEERHTAFVATGCGAVLAVVLWAARRNVLQQGVMMLGLAGAGAAGIAMTGDHGVLPALAPWGVGAVWLLLGWGRILEPQRLAVAAGAGLLLLGCLPLAGDSRPGALLALVTAPAVVGAALVYRDLVLLTVGAVGSMLLIPAELTEWFPDSRAAPWMLLLVGVVLVGAATWTARRRSEVTSQARMRYEETSARVAVIASAAVLIGVAAVVVAAAVA